MWGALGVTEPSCAGTKTCSKCEKDLPVLCFATMRSAKDGLRPSCRECTREAERPRLRKLKAKAAKKRYSFSHWEKPR